jgi:hypothetical protein
VREAELAGSEVAIRVEVDGQPLAGVEQLHQQRRVGAVAGDVLGPRNASGSASMASRTSVPSARREGPREPSKVVLTAPTHSSGVWSAGCTPRSAAIRSPPA